MMFEIKGYKTLAGNSLDCSYENTPPDNGTPGNCRLDVTLKAKGKEIKFLIELEYRIYQKEGEDFPLTIGMIKDEKDEKYSFDSNGKSSQDITSLSLERKNLSDCLESLNGKKRVILPIALRHHPALRTGLEIRLQ